MKKRLENALDDLDQAFESLEISPLSKDDLGRIAGGTGDTDPVICNTSNYTCNSKCGTTAFWECGDSRVYTCDYVPPYCLGATEHPTDPQCA